MTDQEELGMEYARELGRMVQELESLTDAEDGYWPDTLDPERQIQCWQWLLAFMEKHFEDDGSWNAETLALSKEQQSKRYDEFVLLLITVPLRREHCEFLFDTLPLPRFVGLLKRLHHTKRLLHGAIMRKKYSSRVGLTPPIQPSEDKTPT